MRNLAIFLALLIFCVKAENSNLVEDITNESEEEEEDDDEDDTTIQTFPTPPPIGTTSATIGRNRGVQQKFQIFNEKDIALGHNNGYTNRPSSENRSENKARDSMGKSQDQIIAGIPDLNDPCFRRYENSIIVNAQPYERRSSTGLIHCKSHCLSSQSGVYSCKSFVYDNVNMICDLFAHVGDQAPARLLKFQTRDYFEPTYAVHCLDFGSPPSPPPPSPPVSSFPSFEHPVALATNTQIQTSSPVPQIQKEQEQESFESSSPDLVNSEDIAGKVVGSPLECSSGKLPAFLRTEGFELFKNDEEQMNVAHVSECAEACKSNNINGRSLNCKSFDYLISSSTCSFTNEAAVPVGNGQLKQREDAAYHEKICVSQSFVSSCPNSFFSRHPQMILVGFAESVIDSPSFENCFDSCLNSYQLFGFNCTSGMYYFEESQLNCILNSENRNTQKELFTEENTDIVDYFEVECREKTRRKMAGVRNFETSAIQADSMLLGEKLITSDSQEDDNGSRWETWSECIDGKQTRRKSCNNFNTIDDCAEEVRDCLSNPNPGGLRMSIKRSGPLAKAANDAPPTKEEIAEVKRRIKIEGFRCPLNTCCRVFSTCSYGLRHNSHTKQLEWCKRPCESNETLKRARLV